MSPDLQRFRAARELLFTLREDQAAACAAFRWPELEHFNWALDHFDEMARGNDAPALVLLADDGTATRRSFAELSLRSSQVACWLRGLGVQRGDRVLLMLGNELALWELMLACIKLGAVMIPATTLLTPADLADRIARGQVRHVVTTRAAAPRFAGLVDHCTRIATDTGGGALPEGWTGYGESHQAPLQFTPERLTQPDEPLLLYFTSGTTSKPKLVLHTHRSYPVGHLSTMYWIGLKPGDVHWNISSPGWAKHAWSCFFAPWNAGACVFLLDAARFDAARVIDTLAEHGVTTFCAPPTVWRMLIQADLRRRPVRVREALSAGEPLNPEVIEQVQAAWGVVIRDGFGQTETTAQVGNAPGQPITFGSMGRPLPGYRVVLLDAEGRPADEGEICLALADDGSGPGRPTGLMAGYAGDAAKTAEVMRDGHYHTGDVAQRDARGFITYVGRADDVFKASDYRISPFELESVLIEHPAVAEAAVVPSPDPVRLAVPKAFVVLAPGHAPDAATAHDILRFARERLAAYKRVRRLQFAELPKTISGKIRRVELRRQEEARAQPVAALPGEFFDDDIK